ncbi:MAG: hypothetical protein HPY52_11075 [Firmicutes bacterium]|nr:hypothetical protein [Bacillota bacterium]
MTLAELRAECRSRLSEPGTEYFTDAEWNRWLNLAQDNLVEVLRDESIPALCVLDNRISSAGVESYALPADWVRTRMVRLSGVTCMKATPEMIEAFSRNLNYAPSSAQPFFYEWSGRINVRPIPAVDGTAIQIWYVKRPTQLVADADIPLFPVTLHELLVLYACSIALQKDEKYNEAGALLGLYREGVAAANVGVKA